MPVVTVRCSRHRLESVEDQVFANVCRVVRVSEPDLMAKGVAADLLQMAKRIGPQGEAAKHEDLSEEKSLTLDRVVDDETSHRALWRRHRGTLNESTNVGVKTGRSRVGGPDLCVKADGNRKQGTQMFTQVRALSTEVKPYFLLDYN